MADSFLGGGSIFWTLSMLLDLGITIVLVVLAYKGMQKTRGNGWSLLMIGYIISGVLVLMGIGSQLLLILGSFDLYSGSMMVTSSLSMLGRIAAGVMMILGLANIVRDLPPGVPENFGGYDPQAGRNDDRYEDPFR